MIRHLPDLAVRAVLLREVIRRLRVKPHPLDTLEAVVSVLHFSLVAILDLAQGRRLLKIVYRCGYCTICQMQLPRICILASRNQ